MLERIAAFVDSVSPLRPFTPFHSELRTQNFILLSHYYLSSSAA